MATNTAGLHERPTYNKLIKEIQQGEKIKLPNRDALFLRNSPYMAFLDGQGTTEMAAQQEKKQKQDEIENLVRDQASNGDKGVGELRIGERMKAVGSRLSQMFMGSGGSGPADADMDDIVDETGGSGPPPGGGGGGGSAQGPWRDGADMIKAQTGKPSGGTAFEKKGGEIQGYRKVKTDSKKKFATSYYIGDPVDSGGSSSSSQPPHLTNHPYINNDQMVMQALGAHDAQLNRHTAMIQNIWEQGQRAMMQQQHPQHTIVDPVVQLMGNQSTTALALATSTMPIRTPAPIPTADRQVVPTLNLAPDIPKDIVMTMIPKAGAIAPYKPKQAFDAKPKAGNQAKRAGSADEDGEKKQKNLIGSATPKKHAAPKEVSQTQQKPMSAFKDVAKRPEPSIKPVKPMEAGNKATLDRDITKRHWNKQTLQHIMTQLQLRGATIKSGSLTKSNPLTKGDYLKLLSKRDKNIV